MASLNNLLQPAASAQPKAGASLNSIIKKTSPQPQQPQQPPLQATPLYTPRNVPSFVPLLSDQGITLDKSDQTSLLPLLTQAREQTEAQKNAGIKAGASKSNATTDAFSGINKLRDLPDAMADRMALQFGGDSKNPEYTLSNISDGLLGNFQGSPRFYRLTT